MFCPECGTQNPDHAKFCISCGYQNRQSGGGGMPPQQFAAAASGGSKTNYLLGAGGVLALLVIAGLVSFILLRGSSASDQDGAPTPRAKNTANTSNTSASNTQATSNTTSVSNTTAAAPTSTPTVVSSQPAPQATAKPVKKPVDCDGKCYRVYDQCMADYRQHADPETICRGRQTSCLAKCS